MSTEGKSTITKIIGVVSGAAAITIVAIVAHATGHDDFARGAVIGGAAALLVMIALWARAARGGAAARVASGIADERERRIVRDAGADAGTAMFVAALGGAVWSLFGAEAIAVAGIVLWVGLLAFVVSFSVRAHG